MDSSQPLNIVSADGIAHYQATPEATVPVASSTSTPVASHHQNHLAILSLALFGLVAGLNLVFISAANLAATPSPSSTFSVIAPPEPYTGQRLRVNADGQGFQQPGSTGSSLQAGSQIQLR